MSNLRLALVIDAVDNSPGVFANLEKTAGRTLGYLHERFERVQTISEAVNRSVMGLGLGIGVGLEGRKVVELGEQLEQIATFAGMSDKQVRSFGDTVMETAARAKVSVDELTSAWRNGAAQWGASPDQFLANIDTVATQIQLMGNGDQVGGLLGQFIKGGITDHGQIAGAFSTLRQQLVGTPLNPDQVVPQLGPLLARYGVAGHTGTGAVSEIGALLATIATTAGRPKQAVGDMESFLNLYTPEGSRSFLTKTGIAVMPDVTHPDQTMSISALIAQIGEKLKQPGGEYQLDQALDPAIVRGFAGMFRDMHAGTQSGFDRRMGIKGSGEQDTDRANELQDTLPAVLRGLEAKILGYGSYINDSLKPVWHFINAHQFMTTAVAGATTVLATAPLALKVLGPSWRMATGLLGGLTGAAGRAAMWIGVQLVGSFPRAGEAAFAFGEVLARGVLPSVRLLIGALPELGALAVGAGESILAIGAAVVASPVTLIAAGIAAIAGGAYLVYRNWSSIKSWWHDWWDSAAEDIDRMRGKITRAVDPNSFIGRVAATGKHGGPGNRLVGEIYNQFTKPGTVEQSLREKQAFDYFKSQGWSDSAAAGLSANIRAESSFNEHAVGDGGNAHGIAQWHRDRADALAEHFGKRIDQMSFPEQLAAMNYELREGAEKDAGNKIAGASSAADAGALVSRLYERPGNADGNAALRGRMADDVAQHVANTGEQTKTHRVALTVSGLPPQAKVTASSSDGEVQLGLGEHMAAAQ